MARKENENKSRNRFKDTSTDSSSGKKGKKRPRSGKSKGSGSASRKLNQPFRRVRNLVRDDRTRKITGLFLILISAYLFIAFTSFLFTWQADQDKLTSGTWTEMLLDGTVEVQNWLGKIGALVSHLFIHNWFGISSFAFVLFFFLLGFRVLFGVHPLQPRKAFPYGIFLLMWLSVTLGFLFSSNYFFLGGAFGYHTNEWLESILGRIGTGAFLVFAATAFVVLVFDPSWSSFTSLFRKKEEPEETETNETATTSPASDPEENEAAIAVVDEQEGGTTPSDPVTEEEPAAEEVTAEETEDAPAGETPPPEEEVPDNDNPVETVELDATPSEASQEDQDEGEFSVSIAEGDEEVPEEKLNEKVQEFGEYDPTLDLSSYQLPTVDLMEAHGDGSIQVDEEELQANKDKIVNTLANYKIKVKKINATIGPTLTLYEIVPEAGVRISKIRNLEDDIALSLAALGIRIIAPLPGRGTVGIEVPNNNPQIVSMRSLISSDKFQNTEMELPMALGKTISNETFLTDLTKMPHLLMAGATGQGKSVGLNAILASLLYRKHPSQVKFVLVDPKKVELTLFNKIERHFLAKLPDEEEPIITDTSKVVNTLNSLTKEMDARYDLLKKAHVRGIKEYNKKFIERRLNPEEGHRYLPYLVLVVDEFADLIMTAGKEIEQPIARLAQLARAIGIHLIIATQRPSVNIITGMIKANFPARIAFRVTSKTDSRTILDAGGAEQLIGKGDMLMSTGSDLKRIQCGFIDTPEIEAITDFIGSQRAYPESYLLPEADDNSGQGGSGSDGEERDEYFEEAARLIVQHQQGSTSLIQRKLKLGYNRAGRIVDQLETAGIIGPFEGSKARKVLMPDEYTLEQFLNQEEQDNNDPT